MSARYFFHLYHDEDAILDEIGVEVSELDQLGDAIAQIVAEMQRAQKLTCPSSRGGNCE